MVTWKDSSGKEVHGICLHFRSDHMVAGTQNANRPYVWVYDRKLGRDKRVANNVLWIVPYMSVIATALDAA
jgi:hypothetical protein